MKTSIQKLILALVWLALPLLAQAQLTYTTNNGAITITGYRSQHFAQPLLPFQVAVNRNFRKSNQQK